MLPALQPSWRVLPPWCPAVAPSVRRLLPGTLSLLGSGGGAAIESGQCGWLLLLPLLLLPPPPLLLLLLLLLLFSLLPPLLLSPLPQQRSVKWLRQPNWCLLAFPRLPCGALWRPLDRPLLLLLCRQDGCCLLHLLPIAFSAAAAGWRPPCLLHMALFTLQLHVDAGSAGRAHPLLAGGWVAVPVCRLAAAWAG